MNLLPPLRTVRDTPPPVGPGDGPPAALRPLFPELPTLSRPARELFGEVVAAGLTSADAIVDAARALGPRINALHTREQAADALAGLKLLTRYQATRVRNGLAHGLVLGPYRVVDRLGGGTVGVVFRGEHPTLKRPAALKVLAADDTTPADVVARFGAEVRLLAGLDHPHVISVYDAGVVPPPAAGQPTLHYVALELVDGGDLEDYVYAHGPQPPGLACEWGRQLATALRAAHAAGLVHRDVKPSNVLLTASRRAKLIDFGLAREFASTRTRSDTFVGSLEFLPPEQFADAPTAGPPADVYGLGATLFWVLTGQLPYPQTRATAEALANIRTGTPRRLKEVRPDVPDALDELVARMLARNPAARPTPAGAAAELAALADPSSHPAQADAPPPDDDTEAGRLRAAVRHLEDELTRTKATARSAGAAVLTALAAAAATRPGETADHQQRLSEYTRTLATALAAKPEWAQFADPRAVDDLGRATAAHDLGQVSDAGDGATHPDVGAGVLDAIGNEHGPALPFLRAARAVVRHHHERWDGTGFPARLAGTAIPPAARVVAVADAYDTLREPRPGEKGLSHRDAVERIADQAGTAFDPAVVEAFRATEGEFESIYGIELELVVENPAGTVEFDQGTL